MDILFAVETLLWLNLLCWSLYADLITFIKGYINCSISTFAWALKGLIFQYLIEVLRKHDFICLEVNRSIIAKNAMPP